MSKLILLNKPYDVICQFSGKDKHGLTLEDFIPLSGVYPAGRLDKDSEGLLLLTDDGALQHRISHPGKKMPKTYWVQVEGIPDTQSLQRLREGVVLKDGKTRPAVVQAIPEPDIWVRTPPIRYRASIPTCWLSITITEGKNRQVRRMTAAIGHPTLRLVRVRIGEWSLGSLKPGEYQVLELRSG